MSDQSKLIKMLEMLTLLSGNLRYHINEIAERFKISERTAYRYIETFKNAGFVISRTKDGYIQVDKTQSHFKELSDLLHFSEEEAWILSKAIHSIDNNTIIKSNLVKKLYSLYDFNRVANAVIKKELSENVHNLIAAIKDKKQVVLHNYQSANSDDIRDRLVEPFNFTTGYINVWCYEISTKQNKIFKISRMKQVNITGSRWVFESEHNAGNLDVFRISSYQQIPVKLMLSLRAKNLLIEEYPLSERYVEQMDGRYIFNGWTSSFEGVGRFILGLSEEIEVLEPMSLKKYLNKKVTNKKF